VEAWALLFCFLENPLEIVELENGSHIQILQSARIHLVQNAISDNFVHDTISLIGFSLVIRNVLLVWGGRLFILTRQFYFHFLRPSFQLLDLLIIFHLVSFSENLFFFIDNIDIWTLFLLALGVL